MDEEFDIFDREVQPRLDRESLGDVDGRERGVEGEIEAVLVASLAVGQTGEMFSIAVEELDTEARAVNPVDVLAREGQVGGEVNLAHLGLLVGIVIDHDDCADGTHEADGIDLGEVQRHDGIAVLDGCLLEHVLSRVLDVNVAVELLRPAASFRPGSVVEVAESDIVAEAAHKVEGEALQSENEGPFGEVGVGHDKVGQSTELVGHRGEGPQVEADERVLVIHVGEVVRGSPFPFPHEGLYRNEENGETVGGIDESHAEDLKAPLSGVGRSGPEVSQSWGLLPRLRDVARVDGYRPEMPVGSGGQACVEGHPVELPLEVLAEAALARLAEPSHLAEIYASCYGKITNHGLDEEMFERFV